MFLCEENTRIDAHRDEDNSNRWATQEKGRGLWCASLVEAVQRRVGIGHHHRIGGAEKTLTSPRVGFKAPGLTNSYILLIEYRFLVVFSSHCKVWRTVALIVFENDCLSPAVGGQSYEIGGTRLGHRPWLASQAAHALGPPSGLLFRGLSGPPQPTGVGDWHVAEV